MREGYSAGNKRLVRVFGMHTAPQDRQQAGPFAAGPFNTLSLKVTGTWLHEGHSAGNKEACVWDACNLPG
eukprot:1157222-Pelagomonas_calceolata.AAC.9